ncbi:MAG: TIGR04255 family protein [Deltaproteobacteria bacterium]|nr:TIGR04255 family protein [Deltaproteobacteria bacterium]
MKLPEFENHPLNEVAMAVQFAPLQHLHTPRLGALWQLFRSRFPSVEEHPPLEPQFEVFPSPPTSGVNVRLETHPPRPRVWFLTTDGAQLVQIQNDRFIRNWRRSEGMTAASYPRYSKLREEFEKDAGLFADFLARDGGGEPKINQCELTYINQVAPCAVWKTHAEFSRVFPWVTNKQIATLPMESEDGQFLLRFILRDAANAPVGRLAVVVQPAFARDTGEPRFIFRLTVRGAPSGVSIDSALKFFDAGHAMIVKAFDALTSAEMHAAWRKKNA